MTFKWKIIRPTPTAAAGELGVTGVGIECETGQMGAADFVEAIQRENNAFVTIFGSAILAGVIETASEGSDDEPEVAAAPGEPEKPKRTRGPNKSKQVEAVAPAPMPVPEAAPPAAPVVDDGIPEALRRIAPPAPVAPAAAAPLPPPLMPAAPPIAPTAPTPPPAPPAAPPTGVLAEKIIADLNVRKSNPLVTDGGQALVDWLAAPPLSLVVKGATYDQAMDVLRMTTDDKLAAAAAVLKIT
jgi:hypothetical protein